MLSPPHDFRVLLEKSKIRPQITLPEVCDPGGGRRWRRCSLVAPPTWPRRVAHARRVLPAATRARVEVRAEVEAETEAEAEAGAEAEAKAKLKAAAKAAAKATAAAAAKATAAAAAEAAVETNEAPPQPHRCAYCACTAAGRRARSFASGWTACAGGAGAGWPSSSSWTDRTSSSCPETRHRPGAG